MVGIQSFDALQAFWSGLDSVHIGHTAVTDDLQSSALKRIVSLARNVRKLDIAYVEELLSKLALDTTGSVCMLQLHCCVTVYVHAHIKLSPSRLAACAVYKSLKNLRSLYTSLTSQLEDGLQLTHIMFCHSVTYVNLRTLAANLPELRCLEGLPFPTSNDSKSYWPLKQCLNLEKLVMNYGCDFDKPCLDTRAMT